MKQQKNENPILKPIFIVLVLLSIGLAWCLPSIHQNNTSPMVWLVGESVVFILLIYSWYLQWQKLKLPVLYVLAGLFFFRMIYFLSDPLSYVWYLRSHATFTVFHCMIFYGIGIIGLHPIAFQLFKSCSHTVYSYNKSIRICLFAFWLILLAVCFWLFQSVHITRDGFDWIERTTQPVWHLYLREPLTIVLYRMTYLVGSLWFEISSKNAIALLTIFCSVAGLFFYHSFLRSLYSKGFDIFLGWILLLSICGLNVLFFGHIEVYPILIAFLFLTYFCIQKYLTQQWSIIPAAFAFSFAFVSHLSAGWLIPAVFCLPFFRTGSHKIRDVLLLIITFTLLQCLFWGGLIFWKYDGSLNLFFERLYQTFHVGLDRAMFIPPHAWFETRHIQDWVAVYLYVMPCVVLLLPVFIWMVYQNSRSLLNPWFFMWLGYFVYTFCWNPDRGYPEDWDLFSPITALTIPVILSVVKPAQPDEHKFDYEEFTICLYITAVGFIPFTIALIWFHHTQRFVTLL